MLYTKSKLPAGGWVGGWVAGEKNALFGSILKAETCQILSLAENPRWSPSVAIILNIFKYWNS